MNRVVVASLWIWTLAVFAGCGGDPTGPDPGLEGGILATFQVSLEEFQVWITNEATIQQVGCAGDTRDRVEGDPPSE